MALPQYQFPSNALLDFSPLTQGIEAVGKRWKDDAKKAKYANALMQAGDIVDPRLMTLAQGMEPDQGTNALFGAYGQAEQRKMTQAQMAETRRMHDQTLALQQQAENRNAAMLPYQIASAKASSETAGIDTQLKQRELNAPKDNLIKLGQGERLIAGDPRTGTAREVIGAPAEDAGYKSLGERVGKEHDIRKEYTAQAKPFIEVRDAFRRVETAARNPSAAGDMSLIFNFMKILDPGSVVREGEFATAQNATGVPDRILNTYNKIISGERLNPQQRADFVNQSRKLYQTQNEQHKKLQSEFADIARGAKLDPKRVGIDLEAAAATQPPAASVPAGAPQIGYDARTKSFNVMNPQTGEWTPVPGARTVPEAEKIAATMLQGGAQSAAAPAATPTRMSATNPQTGAKIVSDDGVNWRPAN